MRAPRPGPEAAAAAALLLLVLALFGPVWLRGLTPFWGDLTYLHHPWQTSVTQDLQGGQLPLWTSRLYLGMPMAANMQRGVFYPGMLPFRLVGFAAATAVFHLLHYWLAGWMIFLWLRSLRLAPAPALAGAAVYALGGGCLSHMSFLNHLAVLALLPALLLFFRRPALLSLSLAAAFCAGYPPFLLGGAALAWGVAAVLARPRTPWTLCAREWLAAGALAAALAACQLLPGAELMALSRRGSGMGLGETLLLSYSWQDLLRWVSPVLSGWSRFDPAVDWTKVSHAGFAGTLAAVWGLWTLPRRRAAGLAGLLAAVLVLILGDAIAPSRWLWAHFLPLRFVRYPGNLAFLGWPLAALLAAAGVSRLPRAWRAGAFFLIAGELLFYAQGTWPAAPRAIFTDAGPLVRRLQAERSPARYLLSPLALESVGGQGAADWRRRLYGLANDAFGLRAAGNFGEPLVPGPCYDFMDLLYRQSSAAEAAHLLPAIGVGRLLTRDPVPVPGRLVYEGQVLWHVYRVAAPYALAWGLGEAEGAALPAGLPEQPLPGSSWPLPLTWLSGRDYMVEGRGPGWAFIAEPRYPGWRAWLDGSPVQPVRAWGAFQKVRVPAGPWRLRFRYDPVSWRAGLALTLLTLLGFGAYWYNLALRRTVVPSP